MSDAHEERIIRITASPKELRQWADDMEREYKTRKVGQSAYLTTISHHPRIDLVIEQNYFEQLEQTERNIETLKKSLPKVTLKEDIPSNDVLIENFKQVSKGHLSAFEKKEWCLDCGFYKGNNGGCHGVVSGTLEGCENWERKFDEEN